MTLSVFFWYILPLIVAAVAFGWIRYDRSRDRLHPGE